MATPSIRSSLNWLVAICAAPAIGFAAVVLFDAYSRRRLGLSGPSLGELEQSPLRRGRGGRLGTCEGTGAVAPAHRVEYQATHDALTGLIHRSRFDSVIQERVAACPIVA
jgi:GGDEF domain-containing protein